MTFLWDDLEDDPSPICATCGVSALPAEEPDAQPICENAACEVFGESV